MCIGRHARGFGDTSVLGPRFCGELELLNTTPSFGGEMALARAAWKDAVHSQILFIDPDCTHTHTIYDNIYGIQGCEQSGTRYVDKSTVRDCRNSLNQIVQRLWIRMITYANINLFSMYGSVYSY